MSINLIPWIKAIECYNENFMILIIPASSLYFQSYQPIIPPAILPSEFSYILGGSLINPIECLSTHEYVNICFEGKLHYWCLRFSYLFQCSLKDCQVSSTNSPLRDYSSRYNFEHWREFLSNLYSRTEFEVPCYMSPIISPCSERGCFLSVWPLGGIVSPSSRNFLSYSRLNQTYNFPFSYNFCF